MFKTTPGWKNTNKNWLKFEKDVAFEKSLKKIKWYTVKEQDILFNWEKVAEFYRNHWFYKLFLESKWINRIKIISKQLLPDTAIYVLNWNTIYIIEMKYQWWNGSVDEKLQAGKFKKLQYQRLVKKLWLKVEFYFILSEFFLQPKYKDVLNYIRAEGCDYFFWELPLDFLWLPTVD